jgi:WD40 repeat protein
MRWRAAVTLLLMVGLAPCRSAAPAASYARPGRARPFVAAVPRDAGWLAWSPDGRRVATAYGESVVIWDAATGQPQATIRTCDDLTRSLAFSPDGRRLATGGMEAVSVWDTGDGHRIRRLPDADALVSWSPDGRFLVTNFRRGEGDPALWDTGSWKRVLDLSERRVWVWAMEWCPGRPLVALAQELDEYPSLPETVIWDVQRRKRLVRLSNTGEEVAWRPDGRLLATPSDKDMTRIWEPDTGRLVRTLPPPPSGKPPSGQSSWPNGPTLAWSPDGLRLARLFKTRGVVLWDSTAGWSSRQLAEAQELQEEGEVAWSRTGRYLGFGGWGRAFIWDSVTARRTAELPDTTASLAWSPTEELLATTGDGIPLRLWTPDGRTARLFRPRVDRLSHVTWSPDGTRLVSDVGARDRSVAFWDLNGARALIPEDAGRRRETECVWAPGGRALAAVSQRPRDYARPSPAGIRLWQPLGLPSGVNLLGAVEPVAWSRDGELLASAATPTGVKVWDRMGNVIADLPHARPPIAWNPSGKVLATARTHGVGFWSRTEGTESVQALPEGISVRRLAWSPEGSRLAIGGQGGELRLWSAGEIIAESGPRHRSPVETIWWSRTGSLVATTAADEPTVRSSWDTSDPRVLVWDGHTGALRRVLLGDDLAKRRVAPSPDRRILATASSQIVSDLIPYQRYWRAERGAVHLWNPETGALTATLAGHQGPAIQVAWSPDGRSLLTAGRDHTLIVWRTAAGRLRVRLPSPAAAIGDVAWSPDGRRFAASSEGAVRVWRADGKELATLYSVNEGQDWLIVTPEGHYAASANGAEALQFRAGRRLWPAERFRDRYERPDLVRKVLAGEGLGR